MAAVPGLQKSSTNSLPLADSQPQFLVSLEPAHRVFFSNLCEFFVRRSGQTGVKAANFWPDVFVESRLPWVAFLESILWHGVALAGLLSISHLSLSRPHLITRPSFSRSEVLYYSPSEYLPPIDTGGAAAAMAQRGEPEHARQPIISVPPEADNQTQTIVTPPDIKLKQEVPVPNMVAWNPAIPSVPLAATTSSHPLDQRLDVTPVAPPPEIDQVSSRRLNAPQSAVIAPAPEVNAISARQPVPSPAVSVVEPPPEVAGELRKLGDINIGHSVVAPAPQLPVPEQRVSAAPRFGAWSDSVVPPPPSIAQAGSLRPTSADHIGNSPAQVVPPSPSLPGTAGTDGGGRIIALGIHPAATPPPTDLAGNRRGEFAATPDGKVGATGIPDMPVSRTAARGKGMGLDRNGYGGAGREGYSNSGLPSGIFVGAGPRKNDEPGIAGFPGTAPSGGSGLSAPLVADNRPMRVTVTPRAAMTASSPHNDVERSIFRDRKSYSMILNMPNLNSAGGSWIIRFAEKVQSNDQEDLTAPEATRKVDPGYPSELMRQNVHGTVILYAVIRRDGSVGDVRVLSSVDERLDQYASAAMARWQFRPATRNGSAIDLEAVITIPFQAKKIF